MSNEQWLPIAGFDGYEVSDMGNVRHATERARIGMSRYAVVSLTRAGKTHIKRIHRLVLEAFVGPCPPGLEARHFPDNDRANNRLSNLSWATHATNIGDKHVHGTAQFGDRSVFRMYPELVRRGANHPLRMRPELAASGDRNGTRTRPDRVARGERQGSSKLTDAQAVEIVLSAESIQALAARFGMHAGTIKRIRSGRIRKHTFAVAQASRLRAS